MIFALLATLFAADPSVVPLPPTGKWVVDYETDMCIVSRPFGADPILLAIQPTVDMTSSAATLYVLVPEKGDKSVRRGQATVTLQPSGKSVTLDYVSAGLKTDQRGYKVVADEKLMKDVAESTGLAIAPGKRTFSMATGQLHGVMSALAKCNDNLMRSWGVDPAARAVPIGDAASWFSPDQYPASALRAGIQGRAVMALTVSPEGKPTACRIVVSSKDKALDETTCRVGMTRSRFEKTTDGHDHYTVLGVRWVMGSDY